MLLSCWSALHLLFLQHKLNLSQIYIQSLLKAAGLLGLMDRKPACQTSKPGSNLSWDTTVHPVCETFNVMRVV